MANEQTWVPVDSWFEYLTGISEPKFREELAKEDQTLIITENNKLFIKNTKNHIKYQAGTFEQLSIEELEKRVASKQKPSHVNPAKFVIITRTDPVSVQNVDVAYLQSQASTEKKPPIFQVASNFNGIESVSEDADPSSDNEYTNNYYCDMTQGPAASISAGAAAITRVLAGLRDKEGHSASKDWPQTGTDQIEFLGELSEYFPVTNGYVILSPGTKKFPKDPKDVEELRKKVKVGIQRDAQVTFGQRREEKYAVVPHDKNILVNQIFCAALNISQGSSGYRNYQIDAQDDHIKTRFILDTDYEGTYLAALDTESPELYLTLIGGGAFGNDTDDIIESILKAHLKWGIHNNTGTLETVNIVFFGYDQSVPNALLRLLKKNPEIKYEWKNFSDNKAEVVQHNLDSN